MTVHVKHSRFFVVQLSGVAVENRKAYNMNLIRKIATSLALLLILGVEAFAQSGSVTAKLVDSTSGEPLGFATVSLTQKNAAKVYKYVLSNDLGEVKIENVKSGTYVFKAELMGYKLYTQEVSVKGALDLGDVKIAEDKEVLDAASVTAAGNPVIIKKDTVEYNASSFKTTDNDVLEDLLKKLPGVEVSEDGSITVNGEAIKKVTIDGKTFFLDDPQLASKNIPAKIINKVKVVKKKSDQAEFTGIEDGEDEQVIDLSVKPGMMKGAFGNVMAGAGHDMPSRSTQYDDARYQGAAFLGKFTEDTQLSLILNANNTNNRGFNDMSASMMGGMRGGGGGMGGRQGGWGQSNGITTSYMGGLNGAWTLFDGDMDLGGNYLYNGTEKNVLENSSKTTHLSDHELIYNNDGASLTNTYGHRLGMRLDHKFSENTSILFQPSINFGTGNFSESSDFNTLSDYGSGSIKTNDGFNRNIGDNKNWSTSGFALFRQRLGIPGRTLTVMSRYSFSNNDLHGFNQSRTTTYGAEEAVDSLINQRFEQNARNSSVMGRATYTEPLGSDFYVEANYEYSWNNTKSFKDTYDSGMNRGFAEGVPEYFVQGETHNDIYSNSILNRYVNQSIGANVLYQKTGLRAQLGFAAKPTNTHNETYKNGQLKTYDSKVLNWAPQAMLFYDISDNSNIRAFYFGRSSQPSTRQLMPVPDNTDPLDVSFGNPTLKPYFAHNLRSDLRFSNKKTFSSFNAHIEGNYTQSPIVSALWYGTNGAQYSMPFNGPSSGSFSGHMFVNLPIGKSNFTLTDMTRASYSNSSSYVGKGLDMSKYYTDGEMDYESFLADHPDIDNDKNFDVSNIQTLNLVERLRLTYRNDDLELRASGRTRYSKSWYSIRPESSSVTWNNQISASVNWTWTLTGITFKSDYEYNWYRGYTTRQPDEHILNAEINKLLFKNKVTLAVKGYDIFDQAKNLTVTDESNFHMETRNNTLGRYLILSLTYRFGTFDRSKMRGPMGGPGGRGPMGPPPGR